MVSIIGNRIPIQTIPSVQSDNGLGNLFDRLSAPLMNRTAGMIDREKLSGMQRENRGIESAAQLVGGAQGPPNINELASALILGDRTGELGDLMLNLAADAFGADDIRTVNAGVGAKVPMANTSLGQQRALTNNLDQETLRQQGADGRQIGALENALQQETLRQDGAFNRQMATPQEVMGPNGPVFATQGTAVGRQPILSMDQTRAAQWQNPELAEAVTPAQRQDFMLGGTPSNSPLQRSNYRAPDGSQGTALFNPNTGELTDQATGLPLPAGAQTFATNVEGDRSGAFSDMPTAAQNALLTRRVAVDTGAANIRDLVTRLQSPDAAALLGPIASVASFMNSARSQIDAVVQELGGETYGEQFAPGTEIAQRIDDIMNDSGMAARLQELSIDANTMRSLIQSTSYIVANEMKPGGRLAVQDVENAMATIGAGSMDPVAMAATLQNVARNMERNLDIQEQRYGEAYGGNLPGRRPTEQSEADAEERMMQRETQGGRQFSPTGSPPPDAGTGRDIDAILQRFGVQ